MHTCWQADLHMRRSFSSLASVFLAGGLCSVAEGHCCSSISWLSSCGPHELPCQCPLQFWQTATSWCHHDQQLMPYRTMDMLHLFPMLPRQPACRHACTAGTISSCQTRILQFAHSRQAPCASCLPCWVEGNPSALQPAPAACDASSAWPLQCQVPPVPPMPAYAA